VEEVTKYMLKIDPEFKNLIPPLLPEERAGLEKSLLEEGCRDSIVVWNETIIDGHNRYEICNKHFIDFGIVDMKFDNRDDVIEWIYQNQLSRRNLTDEKRTYLIGKQYEHRKNRVGAPVGNRNAEKQIPQNEEIDSITTAEKIAIENNISKATVERAEQYAKAVDNVAKNLGNETKDKILSGELKTSKKDIIELSKLEPEKQAVIFKKVEEEGKDLKNVIKETAFNENIQTQREEIESGTAQLPEGTFEVLVVDPPWNYGTEYSADGRRVANPYPEMTHVELLNIEIPASEDAIMFLWTTHRFIWDARALLDKWGFNYRNIIVWNKEKIGMGDLFRMQCEFCIVGIRGKPILDNDHTWRDIITEARREHSRKPDGFYEMVDRLCVGRKLDYFSRIERPGWATFGNDTGRFS
jgi:N6-adenosine-specific RNA methylase IME4